MSTSAVGGGSVNVEGFLKFLLQMHRSGYALGLNVTQRGAGANMSVDVNVTSNNMAGGLFATSANIPYFGYMDAAVNAAISTSDPSNPRRDIIVAYIDLSLITTSTTNNAGALKYIAVAGTPAGSPSDPSDPTIQSAVGAGNPYLKLARVAVAAAASTIVNANITDLRVPAALQVPYLYGGSSNTVGHLVPNAADDTVALLGASQTWTGSNTFGAGTNINGSFASYSPTWTNLSVGNGTVAANYFQLGKFIKGRIKLIFGSTTSISGSVSVSTPSTANSNYSPRHIVGEVALYDNSATTTYLAKAVLLSTSALTVQQVSVVASPPTTATTSNISASSPFVFAVGDEIVIDFGMEAA